MTKFVPLTLNQQQTEYRNVWNPLRYVTEREIGLIIDASRSGRISQLQLLYSLVEELDLTLAMCITRRNSSLPDWTIKRRDTRRYRSYDEKLAQEQESFLYDQFVQCEDSGTLLKAITTLHNAVFRGLGVIEPIYDEFGLKKIVSLDPWNFAIDFTRHDELGNHPLYWNPTGADIINFKEELEQIPEGQVIANFSNAPIDNFGLQIFLAEQMGFESYSKLVARKGLPATYVVAPEDLPAENLDAWANRAVECAKGGSGAFPFGSNIISQNIDPGNAQAIQDFLEWMSKQIVLASTGGTLTSLAQATGLGSNIADVQNDVFKTIVRHDAYKIGDLMNRGIAKQLLDWQFPGKPHLVYFDLADEAKQNPEKYLADAVSAKNAGLSIDLNQLQELTGYKLTKDETQKEEANVWTVPSSSKTVDEERKEEEEDEKPEEAVVENVDSPDEAESAEEVAEEAITNPQEDEVRHGMSILKAFDKMLAPIKALFQKLFTAKTKEESDAIVSEINGEIQKIEEADDNELIKAVTQLMFESFEDGEAAEEEITNSECRAKDPAHCRVHGTPQTNTNKHYTPRNYEPDPKKWPMPDKKNPGTYKQKNKERAQQALDMAMDKKTDVPSAVISKKLGPIDFVYGKPDSSPNAHDGFGLVHIETDHSAEDLAKVPEMLAYGKYYPDENERGVYLLVKGDTVLSLKIPDGCSRYSPFSCYDDPIKAARYRSRGGQIENMESK